MMLFALMAFTACLLAWMIVIADETFQRLMLVLALTLVVGAIVVYSLGHGPRLVYA